MLLALGTISASLAQLVTRNHPRTTLSGLAISLASLVFMFWLWNAKRRAAKVLDSRALEGAAACSLACIQLSLVLFAGSLVFLLAPSLWWADAAAGLALSAFILKEGISSILVSQKPSFRGGCGCH
jgi:divalent metal cation (Fe/Co/Zn/Cd) transporter